jgi:coenzyme F420-reducing hydrogenase gamma subunit
MNAKIAVFQFNGCSKCFHETLLLSIPNTQIILVDTPKSWKPEALDVAIIAGYLLPEDDPILRIIGDKAKQVIAYGSCTVTGGIFGLAYQKGQKITPLKKFIPEVKEIHGCLGEVEELKAAIQGIIPEFTKKQCEICGRKSTCQYLDEVKRQIDLEETADTCFNNLGYMCNGYIARECKEQCVQAGSPCRGCKPLVDRPGLRFLGMFGTLMANIEVASEATGKGGTDKLADEDDDMTKALPDITGNIFRFDLTTSTLPLGKIQSTGTLMGNIMVGRLIEELPALLGMVGGTDAINTTLDAIEAFEEGTGLTISEKVKILREDLRKSGVEYRKAIEAKDPEGYENSCNEIRKIAGNMNLSRLYYGGFRTQIPDEPEFEAYKAQIIKFTEGKFQKGTLAYTINDKGVIIAFSI